MLLGQRPCRIPSIEQQLANVQRWQKSKIAGSSAFRYGMEGVFSDEALDWILGATETGYETTVVIQRITFR